MPNSRLFAALTVLALGACGHDPAAKPLSAAQSAAPAPAEAARGLAFVEAQCSGCHAVKPGEVPPNPQAPSFVAVANEMGFDRTTLRDFFRDGHETPDAMSIRLGEDEAEMVSAYILSLRKPR